MSALGISGPLFPTVSALTPIGSSLVAAPNAWGASETGIEAGWNLDRLSLRAGISNGGFSSNGSFQAAVGGSPTRGGSMNKLPYSPSWNSKEYRFFGNYILDEHGGSFAAYYFTGTVDIPNPDSSLANNPAAMFPDQYQRYGFFVTSPTYSGFKVLAGIGLGTDKEWISDSTIQPYHGKVADSTTKSMGYFGELDYRFDKNWSVGGRYDYFNPITGSNYLNNDMNAISAFVSYCMK
jgi:hypothetical protein